MNSSDEVALGVLHPGAMGASIAAVRRGEPPVSTLWCSDGRSPATAERATAAGMIDTGALGALVERSDVILSVCPPAEAIAVADAVAEIGFDGVYVDANAVSPETARRIGERFDRFVDGGIVGPPAGRPGTTRLYLAGRDAGDVAALWAGSALDVRVLDGGAGAASALKMAYATWTKVSSSLLLAVRALARVEGVESALLEEWELSQPGTGDRSTATAAAVAPKAWRFVGEMEQIAESFAAAGLPPGFGRAAAEVYARLARAAGADGGAIGLDEVLAALVDGAAGEPGR